MDKLAAHMTTYLATLNERDPEDGSNALEWTAMTIGALAVAALVVAGVKAVVPSFLSGIKVPGVG